MLLPRRKTLSIRKTRSFIDGAYCLSQKRLLYPEESVDKSNIPHPNIVSLFQIYSKACIDHFKTLDKNDIIQEDYVSLTTETAEMSADDIKTQSEIDQQFMRSIQVREPNTLDKFVKRSTTAPKEEHVLPKQKDINLRDPALKNKGIRKKKNITNKYEEESKAKNTADEAEK